MATDDVEPAVRVAPATSETAPAAARNAVAAEVSSEGQALPVPNSARPASAAPVTSLRGYQVQPVVNELGAAKAQGDTAARASIALPLGASRDHGVVALALLPVYISQYASTAALAPAVRGVVPSAGHPSLPPLASVVTSLPSVALAALEQGVREFIERLDPRCDNGVCDRQAGWSPWVAAGAAAALACELARRQLRRQLPETSRVPLLHATGSGFIPARD